MEVKVFGPGCARCAEAEKIAKEAALAAGGDVTVTKVSDLKEMMAAGVLSTPAVMVNGVLKVTGRVPSKDEIAGWIKEAAG